MTNNKKGVIYVKNPETKQFQRVPVLGMVNYDDGEIRTEFAQVKQQVIEVDKKVQANTAKNAEQDVSITKLNEEAKKAGDFAASQTVINKELDKICVQEGGEKPVGENFDIFVDLNEVIEAETVVPEAPQDSKPYLRQNQGWVEGITKLDSNAGDAALDKKIAALNSSKASNSVVQGMEQRINAKNTDQDNKISTNTANIQAANNKNIEQDKQISTIQSKQTTIDEKQKTLIIDVEYLKRFHGSNFCAGIWSDKQMSPEALEVKGSRDFALDWYPWLVDMTDNAGPVVSRAKTLKKNNWFRYGISNEYAPAVCVTQEDYDQCNAELYLNAEHTQKYCGVGEFDAQVFLKEHGMTTKLYNVDGSEVTHIRRPWETVNKDLGQVIGRKDIVHLCDSLPGSDGKLVKGVFGENKSYNGANFDGFKLVQTGMSPSPVCTIGNKSRSFFYLMNGETNCQGGKGNSNVTDMFSKGNRTYPRVNDMQQVNNMVWSRANNKDPKSPVPFAEGGFHAINTFITSMEVGYGTKFLHDANLFSSGISSNDSCSNESTWKKYGGVRYKRVGESTWKYGKWSDSSEMCYSSAGKSTNMSDLLNQYYPKAAVNEGQIALSYAAETNILPGVEFQLYGDTYWYEDVPGATTLLQGEMNARLFKKVVGVVNGFLSSGAPQKFDCEAILRIAIIQGMNISGDIFAYWGGGYEQVGECTVDPGQSRYGNTIKMYLEPDQSKWTFETGITLALSVPFAFESIYPYIGKTTNSSDSYIIKRQPYGGYPLAKGGDIGHGECFYIWMTNYWGSKGNRVRVAVRLRGYAHNSHCSPRYLYAYHAASYPARADAGSAQVLLGGAAECNALQAQ